MNNTHSNNTQNSSTFYVILKWNANVLQKTPCETDYQENYLHANCSNRNIVDVPQSLSTDLQSLDLSHNQLKNLDDKAFEKYTNLMKLTLTKMQKYENKENIVVRNNAFRRLEKLEFLDLSDSLFSEEIVQELPSNLKILIVNNNKIKQLKLENLKHLQKIEANNNELRDFPKFHVYAPLTTIEMENNPIDIIRIADIAPFCQLRDVRMSFGKHDFLRNEKQYCECKRLENWFETHNINSTPLNCKLPRGGSDENCMLEFSEPEMKSRRECLARIGKDSTDPMLIIYIMIGALVIVLLLTLYISVKKLRKSTSGGYDSDYDDDGGDYDDDHYDE